METDVVTDQKHALTDSTVLTKILDELKEPIFRRRWAKAFQHRLQEVSFYGAMIMLGSGGNRFCGALLLTHV